MEFWVLVILESRSVELKLSKVIMTSLNIPKEKDPLIFQFNWDKLLCYMKEMSSTAYGKLGDDRCCCIWCDRWGKSENMFSPQHRSVFSWWLCSFMGTTVLLTVLSSSMLRQREWWLGAALGGRWRTWWCVVIQWAQNHFFNFFQ